MTIKLVLVVVQLLVVAFPLSRIPSIIRARKRNDERLRAVLQEIETTRQMSERYGAGDYQAVVEIYRAKCARPSPAPPPA